MEEKEGSVERRPLTDENLVERSEDRARKYGGDFKKMNWRYGDKLYEEAFG